MRRRGPSLPRCNALTHEPELIESGPVSAGPFFMNIITTKAQREARLAVCQACPDKELLFGRDVCGLCHCPLAGKTVLINAKCPAGKWAVLAC